LALESRHSITFIHPFASPYPLSVVTKHPQEKLAPSRAHGEAENVDLRLSLQRLRGAMEPRKSFARSFNRLFVTFQGHRIFVSRKVAEKIEIQTRRAAELCDVNVRQDHQYSGRKHEKTYENIYDVIKDGEYNEFNWWDSLFPK